MYIYWSLKSIPELNNLTPETQKHLWRCGVKKVNNFLALLNSFSLMGLFIPSFGYSAIALSERFQTTQTSKLIVLFIGLMIGASLGGFVYGRL